MLSSKENGKKMLDIADIFIDKGVYKLNQVNEENIFVCEALQGSRMGKLVMYSKCSEGMYSRTSTQYFLNNYVEGDIKELFTKRDNYEQIGKIGINYVISDTKEFLVR